MRQLPVLLMKDGDSGFAWEPEDHNVAGMLLRKIARANEENDVGLF